LRCTCCQLTPQDLIAEDNLPFVEIPLDEMRDKLAAQEVRDELSMIKTDALQKRRERDNIVKDKVLGSLGFVSDRHEGDAY
jgi:hypothetical protein